MELEQLGEILTRHLGAKKEGDKIFLLPQESELTFFVALSGETLPVPRVTRVEIVGSLLVADSARTDRFAIPWASILAVKMTGKDLGRDRGPGFSR